MKIINITLLIFAFASSVVNASNLRLTALNELNEGRIFDGKVVAFGDILNGGDACRLAADISQEDQRPETIRVQGKSGKGKMLRLRLESEGAEIPAAPLKGIILRPCRTQVHFKLVADGDQWVYPDGYTVKLIMIPLPNNP